MSVVTCVTAQDTRRVHGVLELESNQIAQQIAVVLEDIGTDAVKTGMLPSAEIVDTVADQMVHYRIDCLVVDPVMKATSGDPLTRDTAVAVLKDRLFPLAAVITPNIPEAESLVGREIRNDQEIRLAARELLELGPGAVIIKGGHLRNPDRSTDYLFDQRGCRLLEGPRINTLNTRGSGCTFASAIAALLARGRNLEEAATEAKDYVTEAIRQGLALGQGGGPLGHFFVR